AIPRNVRSGQLGGDPENNLKVFGKFRDFSWGSFASSGALYFVGGPVAPRPNRQGAQMDEESIFAAALEKESPRERAAFLDQACQGNAPLRAGVDELLKAYRDASGFLESPAAEFPGTVCLDQFDDETVRGGQQPIRLDFLAPCDIPGRVGRLGPYEVQEVLG